MAGSTPVMCGPANKENGGCADCSPHGLVAYGAGSSVVIVDVRSMQLVVVLPMPALRGAPLLPAPYVTALRWVPEGLVRDLSLGPAGQLRMAAGDRQGRIALWDVGSIQVTAWLGLDGKLGIQDLCWIYGQHWLLAAIHGPSLIVIWDCNSRTSLWKCDASPEILGCIRCDPFDSRQMCAVGLKGSLVTICVNGLNENEISLKQHQISSVDDRSTGQTSTGSEGSVAQASSSGAPALATMPGVIARCLFSTTKRGILYVILSREIIVFDLQFGMTLSSVSLPRSCSKILDYISLVNGEILYCVHVDGKFSAWTRKDGTQAFAMCHLDTLMPPLGTTVPAPAILGVCCSSLNLHNDSIPMKTASSIVEDNHCLAPVPCVELPTIRSGENLIYEAIFLSISDDGRLWHWQIRTESSNVSHLEATGQHDEVSNAEIQVQSSDYNRSIAKRQPLSTSPEDDISLAIQLELTGQLHLLPSSVITMAVPYPSLQAAIPGGGNAAAAPVALVVLATQAGTLELLDPVANAITASFAVHHNNVVRGVRWLGNSRLVSFSYLEVKGKGGGFVNKLVVTCVRSGQSKNFRVLQKPERAPMRALRTSPSGRYMLILFREAPAEVWAMTKNPQMLRSLALPFTVMEWALPPAPRPSGSLKVSSQRQSFASKERPTIASTVAAAIAPPGLSTDSAATTETQQEETAESFAFALVNGSLGVFELRGRRVRDFKPKWPVSSFVSADVLVTAMAYRMPHVVMGDRVGNLRWWDVTTGFSSWFNTHRGGVRRIKFAPVFARDQTRGRIAVLFNDNTFAIYDLDAQDPLANAIIQPQQAGILVVELDWFPTPSEKVDHLSLCVIGADNSFRVLEVQKNLRETKALHLQSEKTSGWGCSRPMPLYSVALLPLPFALALRMLLQLGIHASWFDINKAKSGAQFQEDLRHYLLSSDLPIIGDAAVAELLLKSLEPYRKTGRLLDSYNVQNYNAICSQRCAYRFAFAALHFGDHAEAVFWLQLPSALALLAEEQDKCDTVLQSSNDSEPTLNHPIDNLLGRESSQVHGAVDSGILELLAEQSSPGELPLGSVDTVPNNRDAVLSAARERIFWHDKLRGTEALQRRVHELVAVGDFEAAVTLLLSTPPDSPNFYIDALRAVSLASAVSPGLHELAVKVIAANMVGTDDSLSGTHLLCAVGRYQEACSQLQDAGRWVDACTLAAAHLHRADYARVLEKWAEHVLNIEHNLWRAMILYVAAGALSEALAALRNAQQPDTAAMFLIACHDEKRASLRSKSVEEEDDFLKLPGNLKEHQEDVTAVCEYYGQYQRMLAHLCTGVNPVSD